MCWGTTDTWRAEVLADPGREWPAEELIVRAIAHPPVFPPGEGWSYSNVNYQITVTESRAADAVHSQLDKGVSARSRSMGFVV